MHACSIQNGWLNAAKRIISPHYDERPDGMIIDCIVLHCISLPEGQFGTGYIQALFTNSLNLQIHPAFHQLAGMKVSSHILIERQGEISQFVAFDKRAWHAGRSIFQGHPECNDFSIGIELEGTADMPYTNEQYDALLKVISALMSTYPAITSDRIIGHSDIAPTRKTDPGPYFSWSRLYNNLP
ncbi:MAG: N-acetylmuramyl-L-alanine amidase, negative regulator of AmpC, AmpD [Gammaproteobacteria bacterium]|jgi:AmpD protein|nr:N-acetylmuramyl-L-alanine amidase, negative regulator of AmpC, AmpD [Gammaproteobacteria bacterium]